MLKNYSLEEYLNLQKEALSICCELGVRQDFITISYPYNVDWENLKEYYTARYNKFYN